jgi:serine/threonine protein kinase
MSTDCPVCGKELNDMNGTCLACGNVMQAGGAGDRLLGNRFEIDSIISSSAERRLYRAIDITHNTAVAVKAILAASLDPSDLKNIKIRFAEEERFTTASQELKELSHHGLPAIIETFSGSDPSTGREAYFTVMTFVEGKSLQKLMDERREKPMPRDRTIEYFKQTLEILKYLHTRTPPFVHGDIAEENILVDEGRVFLTGYRIVDLSASPRNDAALPGLFASEPDPSEEDPGKDVYCLGEVMYFLATGEHAEEVMPKAAVLKALREKGAGMPDYFERIVCAMLDPGAESRLVSAARALEMLKEGISKEADEMALNAYIQAREAKEKADAGPDSQGKKKDAQSSGSCDADQSKAAADKSRPSGQSSARTAGKKQAEVSAFGLSGSLREPARPSPHGAKSPHGADERKFEKIVISNLKVAEFNSWLGKHLEARYLYPSDRESAGGVIESADYQRVEMEKLSMLTTQEKEAKIELINSLLDTLEPIKQKDWD